MIRAVFFDVGETLVDETRQWAGWANWLGVTPLTFFAALGAVIARGEHHRTVFELLVPGFDLQAEQEKRRAAGMAYEIEARDLYPDALPVLARLKAAGLKLGIAGNQPESAEDALRRAGISVDHLASSARWGVEKPSPEFFARVVAMAAMPPAEIAYVGDRVDNDVLPARGAGMHGIFVVRGPWGVLHAHRPDAAQASATIRGLLELPLLLEKLGAAP
ncbi:MAG TPA: HAD family hydrolase [Alphaproteobacteria bacterium]|nr:HAD family hydrolase [Alphaproteobacteria bacterium]